MHFVWIVAKPKLTSPIAYTLFSPWIILYQSTNDDTVSISRNGDPVAVVVSVCTRCLVITDPYVIVLQLLSKSVEIDEILQKRIQDYVTLET